MPIRKVADIEGLTIKEGSEKAELCIGHNAESSWRKYSLTLKNIRNDAPEFEDFKNAMRSKGWSAYADASLTPGNTEVFMSRKLGYEYDKITGSKEFDQIIDTLSELRKSGINELREALGFPPSKVLELEAGQAKTGAAVHR